MKELIIQALNDAFALLEKQVPQTKKKAKTISILHVKPLELVSFMKTNNIPDDADFSGKDNGYDAWDDIVLAWEVDVPTSEKEKLEFKNYRFHDIAFKKVYELLTTNGYKRVTDRNQGRITYKKRSNTISYIVMFDNNTVYEMYINKDFDRLVEYYSLYYIKQ